MAGLTDKLEEGGKQEEEMRQKSTEKPSEGDWRVPSDKSSGEAPTAGSTTALGPAAVPEEAPAPAEGMSRAAPAGGTGLRYTYPYLSIATNNIYDRSNAYSGGGAVATANIVPLLGWSKDSMAPCLVYTLMEGGSLQDRLACRGSGALVPLTANKRVLVLTLHGVWPTCTRRCVSFTVTSRAQTCCWTEVVRAALAPLGIAKSLNDNNAGITVTHMHTEHVCQGAALLRYMPPSVRRRRTASMSRRKSISLRRCLISKQESFRQLSGRR